MTLYETIQKDILSKILDGTYPEGRVIPSELELAQMYGVSRPTVRHALKLLVEAGHLEKRRRRGTVVTKPKVNQSFTATISSFEDAMRLAGRTPRTNVLSFGREGANGEVARALALEEGAQVYRLVRLRYADDVPNVFVESYVPFDPYPELADYDLNTTSLYAAMEECGAPVVSAHRCLEVIEADSAFTALLDVEQGEPLLLFHTVAQSAEGTPIEYSIATYRGKSSRFEFDVRRP